MATFLHLPVAADANSRRAPNKVRPASWLAWLRAAARRWRERRILEELDDRALRDIGVSRSQALAEAGKPFWVP